MSLKPIVKTIDVAAPPERAFAVFVERIGHWWPVHSHSRARDAENERTVDVTIEPRVGGRFYETLDDGRQLDWGDVLAFEPPSQLTLAWRMGRDAAFSTTVHVQFAPSAVGCRVTLTHSDWERMADAGVQVHGGYDKGWDDVFVRRYARFAAMEAATPILYGVPESNFVWATRIVAHARGVTLQHVPSEPHADDVLTINPLGKIPSLAHGPVRLSESIAIATYLDDLAPGPRLVPNDPIDKAMMMRWLSLVLAEYDLVLIRRLVFAYLFASPEGVDRAAVEATLPRAEQLLDLLEASVPESGYVAGGRFTLADAFLAPILHYTAATPEGQSLIEARPALGEYLARCSKHQSVQATRPMSA